jgi:hypothetical protein
MSTPTRRLVCIVRMFALACLWLTLASPAAAQFGGFKKKAEQAAGAEAAKKAGDTTAAQKGAAPAPAQGGGGGTETVVLDDQTVDRFIVGLKAGQGEREAAKKENTPYGRYHRDVSAYEAGKDKCAQAQANFPHRATADPKFADRYSATAEKMVKAQEAGNQELAAKWGDSAMAMIDPSCLIKQPKQPDDYYEAQRAIDSRAEEQAITSSKLSRSEFAMAQERAWMILQGQTPPGDASAGEKSAVNERSAELKPLMGLQEQPPARAAKPAAAPAPPPPAASAPTGMSDEQTKAANCMARNAQKHEKEIQALAQRAQAAAAGNDMAKTMAIADTIRQLQSAGCE